MSFGPLRDHILHQEFAADVERVLARLPPERLELRIAEKAFVAREIHALRTLHKRGVQIVVDEAARAVASLPSLASAPVSGLQLDRSWTTAVLRDETARKVCRATMSIAHALDLTPIAAGVDTHEIRDLLLEMGCRYGSGDVFPRSNRTKIGAGFDTRYANRVTGPRRFRATTPTRSGWHFE